MIRTILMLIFWTLAAPVAALIGFPASYIMGDVRVLYRLFMWGAWAGVWITGVRVQTVGLDRFDHSERIVLADLLADRRQLEINDLPELVLRMVGDTYRRNRFIGGDPFMFLRVLEARRNFHIDPLKTAVSAPAPVQCVSWFSRPSG